VDTHIKTRSHYYKLRAAGVQAIVLSSTLSTTSRNAINAIVVDVKKSFADSGFCGCVILPS